MKSDSFKSLFSGQGKEPPKDPSKTNINALFNVKSPSQRNTHNLSFDTSLIKCFCKKDANELEKLPNLAVTTFLIAFFENFNLIYLLGEGN